jgi:hypothetical protein
VPSFTGVDAKLAFERYFLAGRKRGVVAFW